MEIAILAVCAFASFLAVLVITLLQNQALIKSADKRLKMANDMVLKLANSADSLASSLSHIKQMMVDMEKGHEENVSVLVKNRDEYREAYLSLLKKYEEQEKDIRQMERDIRCKYEAFTNDMYRTVQEMAKKTTITNTTGR